jgi:hypothetical protein
MAQESLQEVRTTRTDVRPGLVMVKRETLKEDGRSLIFFDFERSDGPPSPGRDSDE